MREKILAGVVATALCTSACNSYTTMALGAAGVVAGGVILASADDEPECDPQLGIFCAPAVLTTAIVAAVGLTTLVISGAVFTGGSAGVIYDAAKTSAGDAKEPSFEVRGKATAALVAHIRVAARANRCEAAYAMANRLAAREPRVITDLIKLDEHVARCMRSDWASAAPNASAAQADVQSAEPLSSESPLPEVVNTPAPPSPPPSAARERDAEPRSEALRPD